MMKNYYFKQKVNMLMSTLIVLFGMLSLSAQVYTTVPYSTGFESGVLDPAWTATSSLPTGEIAIFTSGTLTFGGLTAYSHSGTKFMGMHHPASGGGAYNLNEAKLHLNLSGQSNLRLSVWWSEWNDETEPQDGIYISSNGGTSYVKVVDLPGASYTDLTWVLFNMSLDSINTLYGLSFTSNYIIKFQQYDNYYMAGGNDGHLYDDLNIYSTCGTSSTIAPTVCTSYTVPSGNATYSSTGIYHDTLTNAGGCDSIITINLTVGNNSSTISPTVCDSYTLPSGTAVYTLSGTYTDLLTNISGCDSVITINLTVNNSYSTSITEVACDSFVAPNLSVHTTSGLYTSVLTNSSGCDSTIIVDLTIKNSTAATITETALDQYSAPSGTIYTTSGTYTDIIPNAAGCDSTITINLTIGYTGIEELTNGKVKIYPNPTTANFKMETLGVLEVKMLFILDNTGAIVLELDKQEQTFDISTLSSGIYYLNVYHTDGIERVKLVKQ